MDKKKEIKKIPGRCIFLTSNVQNFYFWPFSAIVANKTSNISTQHYYFQLFLNAYNRNAIDVHMDIKYF